MRHISRLLSLPISLLVIVAAFASSSVKMDDVVAQVGGEVLTLDDLQQTINNSPPHIALEMRSFDAKLKMINTWIDARLLSIQAQREGLQNDPKIAEILAIINDRTLYNAYTLHVSNSISVSDQQLQAYYESSKQRLTPPEGIKVRHILLRSEEEAREVLAQLRGGANFEELAKTRSADRETARYGGDLGWFRMGKMPEFVQKAIDLKPGQISDVIQSGSGYHILRVDARQEATPLPLETVRTKLINELKAKKVEEKIKHQRTKLKAELKVIVDNQAIKKAADEGEKASASLVLAKISGKPITLGDVNKVINEFVPVEERERMTRDDLIAGTLAEMLEWKVFSTAARREGLHKKSAVKRQLRDAADSVLSAAYINKITNSINVTDEQAKAYYDANPKLFMSPEEIKVRHILAKTEEEARAIKDELDKGKPFAELAYERSIDKLSAARGGDLGWISRGTMPPEFEAAAFGLDIGQVSEIVKTNQGYHLIKVDDKRMPTLAPFEERKQHIIAHLKGLLLRDALDATKKRLRQEFKVSINEQLLRSISSPAPKMSHAQHPGEASKR